MRNRRIVLSAALICCMLAALSVTAAAQAAEGLLPWWSVTSSSQPTSLPEGGEGQIAVMAQNLGDASTNGKVTIVDSLPEGLEAVDAKADAGPNIPLKCVLKTLTCTFEEFEQINANQKKEIVRIPPYVAIEMRIAVRVKATAQTGEVNTATVSGGAARSKTVSRPIEVGGSERFGIEDYELLPENADGSLDTQAGSHPFQLTSVFTLNRQAPDKFGSPRPVALPKDLRGELPAGVFGNPTPFTQCTDAQFAGIKFDAHDDTLNDCPDSSAIGVASVSFTLPNLGGSAYSTVVDPIFNMVPRAGEPARFAFKVLGIVPVFLDAAVRTGSDYGITVTSSNIAQIDALVGVRLTFWGVPGDPRHDGERGWGCLVGLEECQPTHVNTPPPFLVLPTSCQAPFESTAHGDSWNSYEHPAEIAEPVTYRLPEMIDGCNHLPFDPSISVVPDVPDGSTSTGLTVGVHVSQTATLNPEGLAESTLKDTTVALPVGVALNPAGADGLQACSTAQVGFTGSEAGGFERDLFTDSLGEPFCPNASKIGTVKITTPLLPNALQGAVYLAAQGQNPFGSLVAMYIVAQDPVSGTLIKLAGEVVLDQTTGQVVAKFRNTPELPFEDLEMHFFGGERAPLGTPGLCGSYTTNSSFVPWSGNAPSEPSSTFNVTSGPGGAPCKEPLPFVPALTAGTTSIQAGGFSPFTMTMSREDGNQNLKAIELHMPPGLSGTLSTVKLCSEEQANEGTCPSDTEIGETIVSVGLGGDPFSVKGGKVFITGPYKGAPFGLSIVNPAKAGPFDLGEVIVRAKVEVDPITSVLTIVTDAEGPYKIPTIIDGIPLQIKHVNVTIDRPNFTFNPTNCSPLQITGKLISAEGANASLAVPFQATNCAVLAFKPKLTAVTSSKTSRSDGASLKVKLSYPAGPYDANIKSVKVDLPRQLPSRLTTLQKACPAGTFESNPAACPPGSIIGSAKATTPILPVPLAGPAYFVSYGGAKFPELVIVLSGYGVTVDLHGETFINPSGVTSSTFRTIPDVPVGTFELTLPSGTDSALGANANLCKVKGGLKMPTQFVGQNGALIKTSTPISVSGCPKAKAKKAKNTHKGHKKK